MRNGYRRGRFSSETNLSEIEGNKRGNVAIETTEKSDDKMTKETLS